MEEKQIETALPPTCSVALKEWAVTEHALAQNRQIVLLRKGGLLDPAIGESEAGTFSLEYSMFWLMPTFLHQSQTLVKPQHRDLFATVEASHSSDEGRTHLALRRLARVERVWSLGEDDEERLLNAPHIWTQEYLDVRFSYKPGSPLLCAALRVYERDEPHVVPMQSAYGGCRSWIELSEALSTEGLRAVQSDTGWNRQLRDVENALNRSFEYSTTENKPL